MKAPTTSTFPRPRAAVIASSWEELGIDAPALVNRQGLPLARTTKCLLDPLVLRPRVHRNLSRPLLDADDAAQIRDLLTSSRPTIEDASRWYELLRSMRSARRISEGNPQELYFPRAFELAVTHGAPGDDADEHCAEVLDEVHAVGLGANELADLLADADVVAQVSATWSEEWLADSPEPDVGALATAVLDALEDPSEPMFETLADLDDVPRLGVALRSREGLVDDLLRHAGAEGLAVRVAAEDPLPQPALRGRGELPLERTLEQRTRAALRRHREQLAVVSAGDAVEDETWRCLAAYGLHDGVLQAFFVVGIVLSAYLDPLGRRAVEPVRSPDLAAQLLARLRKEAYVMYLRRELAAGQAIHPQQEPVVAELDEFWRPWLNRLWVRLHGRDVTDTAIEESPAELLRGITRSVMLDHRQRIRDVLEKVAG